MKGKNNTNCRLQITATQWNIIRKLTPCAPLLAGGYTPLPEDWCPETSWAQQNKKIQAEGRVSADTDTTTHPNASKWWFRGIIFVWVHTLCFRKILLIRPLSMWKALNLKDILFKIELHGYPDTDLCEVFFFKLCAALNDLMCDYTLASRIFLSGYTHANTLLGAACLRLHGCYILGRHECVCFTLTTPLHHS